MNTNLLDLDYYRRVNPDLANFSDEQATQHFFNFGLREGRDFSPVVDLDLYRAANLDLAAVGFTENRQFFDHLTNFGVAEGRLFSNSFNAEFYRASHADLIAVGFNNEQLFDHFLQFGINEGRVASNTFDIGFYLSSSGDLNSAGLSNRQGLTHFSQFGINEGRITSPQFDIGTYLSLNVDLRQARLTNAQAFNHYQVFGLNERRIAAQLLPVPGDASNVDLGVISGNRRFSNMTSQGGDTYQFTLFRPSLVSAGISTTTNLDISLSLFADLNGNGFQDGNEPGTTDTGLSPNISSVLPAGTYGLSVPRALSSVETLPGIFRPLILPFEYDGNLLTSPVAALPADNAGNSIATARDLGTLTTPQTFNDSLGLLDDTDIYRFTLDAPTNVEALVDGTNTEVTVEIVRDFNNNGEIDALQTGGYREIIEASTSTSDLGVVLDAGTYFLRLENNSSDTNYSLTLAPQALRLFPDRAGNTLPSAFDVGVLNQVRSFVDTVGISDSTDYYQFEIATPTNIGITFDALSGSPALTLGRDFDGGSSESIVLESRDILQSQGPLTAPQQTAWSLHLTPGTYFARVSDEFTESSVYDLEISPTPPPGLPADAAGNNLQTARNLDVLTGMETFSDSVGPADERDLYRFVLNSPTTVDFLLDPTGNSTAVALQVFNDLNNNGIIDGLSGGEFFQGAFVNPQTQQAQDSIFLQPGVYFAGVVPLGGNLDTIDYDLTLSVI